MINLPHAFINRFPDLISYYIFLAVRYTLKYVVLICTFLAEFKRFYVNSSQSFSGGFAYGDLQKDIHNLSKLPKHLSYVINEDVGLNNYCDLANLVVWTIAMGIPYISLYDQHGILKSGEARLSTLIRERVISLFGSKAEDFELISSDISTTYESGTTYPKRVCVQLLSEEDGKPDILEAAKKITANYCEKKIELNDIKVDYVNKSLEACANVPDPELIVQFGPIKSLLGFLPWQTRITEILHLPTHANISYSRFYSLLERYNRCNQRFGK